MPVFESILVLSILLLPQFAQTKQEQILNKKKIVAL